MPLSSEVRSLRKKQVQRLNTLARKHAVQQVYDGAAKSVVEALIATLETKEAVTGADKKELAAAAAQYKGSFESISESSSDKGEDTAGEKGCDDDGAAGNTAGEKDCADEKGQQWEFHAAQLTYNCTQGDWVSQNSAVLRGLLERFVAWLRGALVPFQPSGISATVEESTRAKERHVHIHAYFHLEKAYKKRGRRALDTFLFEGLHPHVEVNRARGKSYMGSVRYGHFYVVVDKIGSVDYWTNYPPFDAYGVEGWWLDNLLKQGKLDRAEYLKLGAKVVIGFQKRLADMRAVERFERDCAVDAHIAAEAALLEAMVRPMKQFEEVEQFVAQFRIAKQRRAILVIIGATNLGKSMLAAAVLREVGKIVKVSEMFQLLSI